MFGFTGMGVVPGLQAAVETFEREFLWGRRETVRYTPGLISGAARDAGNSPTTILRPALLLGMVTADSTLKQYDPTAVDGTQNVYGILPAPYRVTDIDAQNQDLYVQICVGGPVKGAMLLNLDLNARAQMQGRFWFDDDLNGVMRQIRQTLVKTADYSVVLADNGTRFTTRGAAGAVVFTLPDPTTAYKGFLAEFYNEADQNMTVRAVSADKLVAFNDLTATSVALSTSGNKVGSGFRVYVNDNGSAWLTERIGYGTVTVA